MANCTWGAEACAKAVIQVVISWKTVLLKDFLADPVWMDEHAKMAKAALFLPNFGVVHAVLAGETEDSIEADVDIFKTSKDSTSVVCH